MFPGLVYFPGALWVGGPSRAVTCSTVSGTSLGALVPVSVQCPFRVRCVHAELCECPIGDSVRWARCAIGPLETIVESVRYVLFG